MTNPNIPYEPYQNGKYLALSGSDPVVPLIRREDYLEVARRYEKLSPQAREAVQQVARSASRFGAPDDDPLAKMSEATRAATVAELQQQGLGSVDPARKAFGFDDDTKKILRDIRHGKAALGTTAYNVNGHIVVPQHFDAAGNLAPVVAKAYGVPSSREDAIAARCHGIRRELLGAAPRPAQPAKPTLTR